MVLLADLKKLMEVRKLTENRLLLMAIIDVESAR